MTECQPFDVACRTIQYLFEQITLWIIPAIVFAVALVGIIAARSLKGKVLFGVIIFLEVWWFVPIFGFTLKNLLGLGA